MALVNRAAVGPARFSFCKAFFVLMFFFFFSPKAFETLIHENVANIFSFGFIEAFDSKQRIYMSERARIT